MNMPWRVCELTIRLPQHGLEKRDVVGVECPGPGLFGALQNAVHGRLGARVDDQVGFAKARVPNIVGEIDYPDQFIEQIRRAGASSTRRKVR